MPSKISILPYSPDLLDSIIEDIKGFAEKNIVQRIIQCFDTRGFNVKIQHIRPNEPNAYFRVLCFLKKSKETVSINTKKAQSCGDAVEGVDLKIRIENQNTFNKLDEFADNIRNQILNATDCHYCGTKCEGKRYTFTYHGNAYVKCQYLGCNFRFSKIDERDIDSIMEIINGELEYAIEQNPARKDRK